MKKLIILVSVCLLSGITYAQLEKGDWLTSVNGNANINKVPSIYYSFDFTVRAGVLKLVRHNLGVGLSLGTTYVETEYKGSLPAGYLPYNKNVIFEPSAVVRKYFGSYRIRPYAELDLGMKIETYKSFYSDRTSYSSITDYNAFIRPVAGLSYWVTDNIAFDLNAGYDINLRYNSGLKKWNMNMGVSVKF